MTVAHLRTSLRGVFGDPIARLAFPAASAIFFALSILLLVATIPGNDIRFQLSILRASDSVLLFVLSLLVGFQAAVQVHAFRTRRSVPTLRMIAHTATPGTAGLFAAAVGTAACASCLASLFGVVGLGLGSTLFVLEYRFWFLAGAVAVVLVSLYVSLRRLESPCRACVPLAARVGDGSSDTE